MNTTHNSYRYHLPQRAIKGDCPQCSPSHRRTLSLFVDSRTSEPLPEPFGRCDRESNCGYYVSPYHKDETGMSYAERVFTQGKADYSPSEIWTDLSPQPTPIYSIPDEVFKKSLGHYDRNQFASLLRGHFGDHKANELLQQFQIGTSTYWPGATVFWLIDTDGKARAGQVNLFADDWHRAKYTDREGNVKPCISSVSHGLLRHYREQGENVPDWLTDYHDNATRWPIPFGLHQLRTAPADKPVAIVEACKTAVVCAGYFPQFLWLAIGSKSNLTHKTEDGEQRLAGLKKRQIVLFPDLNAYHDITNKAGKVNQGWLSRANEFRSDGFQISVSSLLEENATEEQRRQGLDLADFLLQPQEPAEPKIVKSLEDWALTPGSILRPDEQQLIRL